MKLLKNLHKLVIYLDGEIAFIGYTIIATAYKLYALKSHTLRGDNLEIWHCKICNTTIAIFHAISFLGFRNIN